MSEGHKLKHGLLAWLAPQPTSAPDWQPEQWDVVLKMARQHRLLPLLHWRLRHEHREWAVPAAVKQRLAQAFERATRGALAWQRELLTVQAHLTQAGIPCLALKGAYLALHSYPHPALRPLRDLDLLVPLAHVLAAQRCLLQAGYRAVATGNWEACLATKHHLPVMEAPTSRQKIELHFRLHPLTMRQPHAVVWERLHAQAVTAVVAGQAVAYLAPTDLLLHLIAHAVYQHRFDNGPLLLTDIAYLLQREPIDWQKFWQEAQARHWSKGCVLVLRLVANYYPDLVVDYPQTEQGYLPEVALLLSACAELMLGDLTLHADLHLASELAGRSWYQRSRYLLQRLFPTPTEIARGYTDAASTSPRIISAYLRRYRLLLTQRLPRLFNRQQQSGIAADAGQVAVLERWLLRNE